MNEEMTLDQLTMIVQLMKLPRYSWRYSCHSSNVKMSNAMYNICIVISQKVGISQDGVAKTLKMDKSSVAKIVCKAEKDGYILRSVNPKDHREYCLALTEDGRLAVEQLMQGFARWQEMVLHTLEEKERNDFKRLLNTVFDNAVEIEKIEAEQ